jgi:parallel beta-helix repeat protein
MTWFLRKAVLVAFCCVLISFTRGVAAKTYYVAPTGSDVNPGTLAKPFDNIKQTNGVVRPGDTVLIREGVYTRQPVLAASGTRDNPITYQSYPGETAVFDGSEVATGSRDGWFLVQGSWIIVRDIVVQNSPGHGIFVASKQASDNVFGRIVTRNNFNTGLKIHNGNRNLLLNITAHSNFSKVSGGGNSDGIAISLGTDNTIRNCHTYNNSDDGVDIFLSTNTTIRNCISHGNGANEGDGNGFKLGGGRGTGGHRVTKSIAYGNRTRGFDYNGATIPITVFNNTAFSNPTNFAFQKARHVLRNNISHRGRVNLDPIVDDQYNSWNLGITDPQLAKSPIGQLTPTSLAIDVGIGVGLPFSGVAPDLGAREFIPNSVE